MKLTLNTESSVLLVEVKTLSGGSFNALLKEAIELLNAKYKLCSNNIINKKDQNDPSTDFTIT